MCPADIECRHLRYPFPVFAPRRMNLFALADVVAAGAIRIPYRCEILGLRPFGQLPGDIPAEVLAHDVAAGGSWPYMAIRAMPRGMYSGSAVLPWGCPVFQHENISEKSFARLSWKRSANCAKSRKLSGSDLAGRAKSSVEAMPPHRSST